MWFKVRNSDSLWSFLLITLTGRSVQEVFIQVVRSYSLDWICDSTSSPGKSQAAILIPRFSRRVEGVVMVSQWCLSGYTLLFPTPFTFYAGRILVPKCGFLFSFHPSRKVNMQFTMNNIHWIPICKTSLMHAYIHTSETRVSARNSACLVLRLRLERTREVVTLYFPSFSSFFPRVECMEHEKPGYLPYQLTRSGFLEREKRRKKERRTRREPLLFLLLFFFLLVSYILKPRKKKGTIVPLASAAAAATITILKSPSRSRSQLSYT